MLSTYNTGAKIGTTNMQVPGTHKLKPMQFPSMAMVNAAKHVDRGAATQRGVGSQGGDVRENGEGVNLQMTWHAVAGY